MNKIFRVLEIVWLVMAGVGIVSTAYFIILKDNHGAIFFILFTFVSGIMFSVRRRQRKKFEAAQQHQKEQKK